MKSKFTLRLTQLLLFILLGSQIYSWIINLDNTSIAYNKELTTLLMKENRIKNSEDISFLKKQAIEGIQTVRLKNKQMHKTADFFFLVIPVQAITILIILIICTLLHRIKRRKSKGLNNNDTALIS